MSSYPVAQYRNSSQPRYPPAFKPGALPVPANDNIPTPANDNWRPPMPKARVNANLPKWSTAARIARGSGRVLGRAVPILGWVLTAWDLWNFYQVRPEGIEGYELVRRCKPGRGVFKQNGQANCSITIEMDPWLYPATGRPFALFEWSDDGLWGWPTPTAHQFSPIAEWRRTEVSGTPVEDPNVVQAPQYWPEPWRPPAGRPRTRPRKRPRQRPSFPGLPFEPIAEPNGPPRTPLPRSQTLTITPGIKGQVSSNPYIARRPPGPGVKERKVKSNAPGLLLMLQKIAHTATEAIDFIDALHDALPKRFQAKGDATPQQKAQAVYRHINEIDVELAIRNLIINHITDSVIGRSNAAVKKWATDNGIILGPYGLGYKL